MGNADSRISRAAPFFDQAAAATDESEKRRLYSEGWVICRPQMVALACKSLNREKGDMLDDTVTYTSQKLWRAIQTGYTPTHGYEAILSSIPSRAAARILTRNQKHKDNPTTSLDKFMREGESLASSLIITAPDEYAAVDHRIDHGHLRTQLVTAARRARILGNVLAASLLLHGLDDTHVETARALGVPTNAVTAAIEWLQSERHMLLTASDDEFRDYLMMSTGGVQMCLLDAALGA